MSENEDKELWLVRVAWSYRSEWSCDPGDHAIVVVEASTAPEAKELAIKKMNTKTSGRTRASAATRVASLRPGRVL